MSNHRESIVIVCDRNPYTSFGLMAIKLRQILADDYNVRIAWLTSPKYFRHEYDLPDGSIAIRAPSLETGWLLFRKPFRRLLREIRPDMVFMVHQGLGFLVGEVRKVLPGAWVGAMIHDLFTKTAPRSLKHRLFYTGFIAPIRKADGFVYNSEYTRMEAEKVLSIDRGHAVVGSPLDRSLYCPVKKDKKALRKKWGLDKYDGMCLNVSLDEPRKNIRTFFALAKERPQIAFVRVGSFSPWMKKWIDNSGVKNIIHYHGLPLDQLVELFGCADLFVFPSFLEGFGMPPLEALARGVPVAAAKASAVEEILAGIVPLVSPPDNVDGYLKIIDGVLSGKNVVDWQAAEKLLEWSSIEKFGDRVRLYLKSRASQNG